MKFGMNLLLWTGELNDGMIPVLKMLKNLGYDGVELPIFNTGLDYAKWGKMLDDLGLERTAVTVRDSRRQPDQLRRRRAAKGDRRQHARCSIAVQRSARRTLVGPYHSALGHFSGAGPHGGRMEVGRREHAGRRRARGQGAT